jgi:hypothetical protein
MANELFIELARDIPIRYVTPATGLAQQQLNTVLAKATDYIRARGNDEGLEEAVKPWLVDAERRLATRMEQMRFDE